MKKENFTMKELPDSEKPYEKCERDGAKSLSNAELLAVILKSGTKDKTSLALALEVLSAHPSFQGLMGLFHLTRNQLLQIHGIGPVKAVQILCAVELSKRLARESVMPQILAAPNNWRLILWMKCEISKRSICILQHWMQAEGCSTTKQFLREL